MTRTVKQLFDLTGQTASGSAQSTISQTLTSSLSSLFNKFNAKVFAHDMFTKEDHPMLKPEWEKAPAEEVAKWIRDKGSRLVLRSTD